MDVVRGEDGSSYKSVYTKFVNFLPGAIILQK